MGKGKRGEEEGYLCLCGFLVEREPCINLGRNSSRNDLEDLLSKFDQLGKWLDLLFRTIKKLIQDGQGRCWLDDR